MAFRTDGWRPLELEAVKFYSRTPLTILEASCHLGQVRRDKASRNESHSMSESVRFGQDVRKAFKTHLGEVARRQAGALDILGGGDADARAPYIDVGSTGRISRVYFKTEKDRQRALPHRCLNGSSLFLDSVVLLFPFWDLRFQTIYDTI
ncbi:hypothetical protein TcasGA2_TC008345 [Tribolium castaneum]|uniref:Uncharacterized protein n=1 Tax=Tribolium castaneum TaxID=7070 RepID=D2A174_TRICA|nr:hypothetical protein TcasGA2_TC008345 [Tribolium castaneum]